MVHKRRPFPCFTKHLRHNVRQLCYWTNELDQAYDKSKYRRADWCENCVNYYRNTILKMTGIMLHVDISYPDKLDELYIFQYLLKYKFKKKAFSGYLTV